VPAPATTPVVSTQPAALLPAPARFRWLTLAVLCVSLLVVSLDNTILTVALPTIERVLHASSSQLQWIVDAYVLVFAGLLLTLGSLGDRIGRKVVFMAGLALFAGGSTLCAFASTPDRLIAARAFLGIGAAAIMPSTLSILINLFPEPAERAKAIGIWSGTSGLGVAIGPVAGGWLLAHYWWGSIFLVNVPIALAGLVAAALACPSSKNPASKRPDPVGAALSIAGMALLVWGIIDAPERGWSSPVVLAAIIAGAVVLAGFVAFERRSSHPMLEIGFFRSLRFSAAMAAMAMVIFALMGTLFLVTQYLQFSLGYSPLDTGLRVAPVALLLLVAAPASMLAVHRLGTKPVVFTGMALIALGLYLISRVHVGAGYSDLLPAFILLGIGTGLSLAPSTDAVMGTLPLEEAGAGAATNSAALQVGAALGVAVLGSLLNTRYQNLVAPALARYPVPTGILELILGSVGGALAVAARVPGAAGHELAALAERGFVSGLDLAMVVGAGVVLAGALVAVLLIPNRPRR
jgi:EmrB/QacA subfamily drug resistance transporter